MATNKNQHFVPRCYLRPFTVNGEGTAINLYNIDRQKFISNAPVKNQCAGNYFYGQDDTLEKAIQSVEGAYGSVLREIIKPNYVLTNEHKYVLRIFWLFQYLRTEAAAKRATEMTSSISEVIKTDNKDFNLKIKDAVLIGVHLFAEEMRIIDDLKICLIKNKTKLPFITSDDPAVLTNRWWLSDNRTQGHSFGLTSSGNITLLPITPDLLCVGYDGDVYNVSHISGIVDIRDEKDILSLNQHQILNCRANLFVHDIQFAQLANDCYLEIRNVRPPARHLINYAIKDIAEGDYVRYLVVNPKERENQAEAIIHAQTIHPEPLTWPKQIKFRSKGAVYTNGTGVGYIRQSAILRHTGKPFYKERTNYSK